MDTFAAYVWEPAVVKINALTAATEAACLILSVDETVCTCTFWFPNWGLGSNIYRLWLCCDLSPCRQA